MIQNGQQDEIILGSFRSSCLHIFVSLKHHDSASKCNLSALYQFREHKCCHLKQPGMNDIINDENVNVSTQGMNAHITHEEVRIALNHDKLGKSVGIDLVPTEVLRTVPVYPFLVKLFNMCFKYGITHSAWQKGIINSIPKSGDKDPRMPLNYRGMTLTCQMYKIYCTILKFRLTKYLEDNNILVQEQNGFRKMRSCLDHIFSLISKIENRYKRRQSTFVCFMDMRKAFDMHH